MKTSLRRLGIATVLVALAFGAPVARASDNCALKEVASLPMATLPDGGISVPLKINSVDRQFRVQIDNAHSAVTENFAEELQLKQQPLAKGLAITYASDAVTEHAVLPDLQIGVVRGTNLPFLLLGRHDDWPYAGILGLDLLGSYDVEIDFKAAKMNLFQQDHCEGKVVYWADTFAALPFKSDMTGHITFKMTLDGNTVTAGLDMEEPHAETDMNTVKVVFGLDETSPGMRSLESGETNAPKTYTYPFKTLSAGGVTILNPKFVILAGNEISQCNGRTRRYSQAVHDMAFCFGGAQIAVGLSELRALHLYFAFKEKTLYVTAADAHR